MVPDFYSSSPDRPVKAAGPVVRIHDASTAPSIPAAEISTPPDRRMQNGRAAANVSTGPLKVRWRTGLPVQFAPSAVLPAGQRILLEGISHWRLLDEAGKEIANDQHGRGRVAVDERAGFFYVPDANGYVAAHRLNDGQRAFHLSVSFGPEFAREFIDREGGSFLVVSVEQWSDPHREHVPNLSVVERFQVSTPLRISDAGRLQSAERVTQLIRRAVPLLPARSGANLVFAVTDRLYIAGADLTLRTELAGEFEPLWLSLDEASRAYLIVRGPALWVVTAAGERIIRAALPQGFQAVAPPIVGYDHTIYVVGRDRLLAISSSGKTLWDQAVTPIGGAVVTTGHRLLVSSGPELLSFDGKGQRTSLFRAEESLATAPAITARGELIVAGQQFVYCLTQ